MLLCFQNCSLGTKLMERSCNHCTCRRARWFCAPDDAFLCQPCDALVHSANALARRHEKNLLKTASLETQPHLGVGDFLPPGLRLRGFTTRKPRTPPHAKHEPLVVPDLTLGDASLDEETEEPEQHRVPIYVAAKASTAEASAEWESTGSLMLPPCRAAGSDDDAHRTISFPPSELELTEFVGDMESLLGSGMEQRCCFGIDDTVLLDERKKQELYGPESVPLLPSQGIVPKIKDEEDGYGGTNEEKIAANEEEKKKILLRLDYLGVMAAWEGQGSPWTGSDRPELDPDDCWPARCMGMEVHYGRSYEHAGGLMSGGHSGPPARDVGGREARVSRYKEKRRTRLFTKKIRYEVRKLNAEKRPRMKGRFVKRASSSGTYS